MKELLDVVTLDSEQYFQNFRIKSDHKEKIEAINININSKYFTTTSKDCVMIWQLKPTVEKVLSIPFEMENENPN